MIDGRLGTLDFREKVQAIGSLLHGKNSTNKRFETCQIIMDEVFSKHSATEIAALFFIAMEPSADIREKIIATYTFVPSKRLNLSEARYLTETLYRDYYHEY